MEAIAGIAGIIDVASRVIMTLSQFIHETKSVDTTILQLFAQVSSFRHILDSVQKVLQRREAQRPDIPKDDPELEIWHWARDILLRCERTMRSLENELHSFNNKKSSGWLDSAKKQLKLNINSPAIARIENQMAANVSSAQLMMACFQTFTQEETQITLTHGIENLYTAIQVIRADIARLSPQMNPTPVADGQTSPLGRTASNDSVATTTDSGDDDLDDIEKMKGDADFATSLVDKLSVSSGSVTGTKTPLTYRSVLRSAEVDDKTSTGRRPVSLGSGYESSIRRKPANSAPREHDTIKLDTKLQPEILSTLIDNCRDEAKAAYEARDYPAAEANLRKAIRLNESRDRDGTFPFEDSSELRQSLAEIMSRVFKFDEAADEYETLIKEAEAKGNDIRKATLCFSLARMYRAQSNHSGDNKTLAKAEDYATHALNSALGLSQEEGRLQWPCGHPSLHETAQLLVDVLGDRGSLVEARTYRDLFLRTTKAATPLSPPEPSTHSVSPGSSPMIGSGPTTSDSNHNDLHPHSTHQTSTNPSVAGDLSGFGPRPIARSSFSHSVSVGVCNDIFEFILGGHCGVLERLLDDINIEARSENDLTPLLFACKEKKLEVVRFLLERPDGAAAPNLAAQDSEGCTGLHLAIIGTDSGIGNDIVNLLIKHGADVNTPTAEDKMSPLHYAVRHNKLQSARALLEAGADIEALDRIGRTPLTLALKLRRREDMCCLLIRRGANYDRSTALRDFDELDYALADWDRRYYSRGGNGTSAASQQKMGMKKWGSMGSRDSVVSEVSMMSRFTNMWRPDSRRSSGIKGRKGSFFS